MTNDDAPSGFFFDYETSKKVTETGQKLVRELEQKLKYIMTDMREHIGSYYGNLVTFEEFGDNDEFNFSSNGLQGRSEALEYFEEFMRLGVEEILFDCDGNDADTAFFRIGNKTDLAELMVHIHTQRPGEFTRQDNKQWFRLWWD